VLDRGKEQARAHTSDRRHPDICNWSRWLVWRWLLGTGHEVGLADGPWEPQELVGFAEVEQHAFTAGQHHDTREHFCKPRLDEAAWSGERPM